MEHPVDCFFWDPAVKFDTELSFTSEDIGDDIFLRKPVFTIEALEQDKTRHRFRQVATVVSILIAVVLTAGFAAICFMGVDPAIGIVMQ